MQQGPSVFIQCSHPLRHHQRHPSADPPRDLGLRQGPSEEVTLQLPRVWPRPRQPHVDIAQLRWPHGVPGGGQVLDRPNPAEDTLFGVLPCDVRHTGSPG